MKCCLPFDNEEKWSIKKFLLASFRLLFLVVRSISIRYSEVTHLQTISTNILSSQSGRLRIFFHIIKIGLTFSVDCRTPASRSTILFTKPPVSYPSKFRNEVRYLLVPFLQTKNRKPFLAQLFNTHLSNCLWVSRSCFCGYFIIVAL